MVGTPSQTDFQKNYHRKEIWQKQNFSSIYGQQTKFNSKIIIQLTFRLHVLSIIAILDDKDTKLWEKIEHSNACSYA